jgi:citrate synthase
MNAAVGGAPAASALISALAIGAGQTGGCREIFMLTHWFDKLGLDIEQWIIQLNNANSERTREDIWNEFKHPPGFKRHGVAFPESLQLLLSELAAQDDYPVLKWLQVSRIYFEGELNLVMNHTFIAAAVFHQLGFKPAQAEMCALLMILPGAAVHALEAKEQGWRKFPFFGQSVELVDDPGVLGPLPDIKDLNL